jgi:hypothetical protein
MNDASWQVLRSIVVPPDGDNSSVISETQRRFPFNEIVSLETIRRSLMISR